VDSLYLLIPIALVFCAVAIKLLLWAISSGQYDDLDKEAWRILAEDEPASPDSSTDKTNPGATTKEKP
jgi:cbb3-type cytochrome oxidase maturation protein